MVIPAREMHHLAVAFRSSDVSQSLPVSEVRFGDDAEFPARHGKRVVHSRRSAVNDGHVWTIPREQSVENLFREIVASPMSIASYQDTHVQSIVRARG
jgi:hypothetical protein